MKNFLIFLFIFITGLSILLYSLESTEIQEIQYVKLALCVDKTTNEDFKEDLKNAIEDNIISRLEYVLLNMECTIPEKRDPRLIKEAAELKKKIS